ncbi:MAG: hypothetical protein EB117_15745 [Betaproteobacteria bacterium]|nr:hypothetical protein [Betaproteobacteria bacterium]
MAAPTRRKAEPWTIGRILHTYGLRIVGGSLAIPSRKFGGGGAIRDEAEQAMDRVMETKGYYDVQVVLKWVYAEGKKLEHFRPNLEQERECRERWGIGPDFPIQRAATGHYWGFIETLEASLKERPFLPELFEKDEDAV